MWSNMMFITLLLLTVNFHYLYLYLISEIVLNAQAAK